MRKLKNPKVTYSVRISKELKNAILNSKKDVEKILIKYFSKDVFKNKESE